MSDDVGWRQLTVVHLSDMHFGVNHFFNPPAYGALRHRSARCCILYSRILKKGSFALAKEFPQQVVSAQDLDPNAQLTIFALTGDFNECCTTPEFKSSQEFLKGLYGVTAFGHRIQPEDIFIIPGNHDLKYGEDDLGDRWGKFVLFYKAHNDQRRARLGKPVEHLDRRVNGA